MRTPGPLKITTLLIFTALLSQCSGKKSRSAESAEWSVLPKQPIVILGPTKDAVGNDIAGPWFSFRLAMSNFDTLDSITILAVELEIQGTDAYGLPVTTTASLSPSKFDHSYKVNDTEFQCKYFSFGEFPAGVRNQELSLSETEPNCSGQPLFILGGFAKKDVGATYRYKVKTRPLGWFGTFNEPKDRFDMTFNFTTK